MSDFVDRKFGSITVRIDRSLCISSANCLTTDPPVFDLDDQQVCTFAEEADEVDRDTVIDACRRCPVEALVVIDEDGTRVVP